MRWLLALLLVGCAAPSEVWHGDERFTLEQRAQIAEANVWLADRMHVDPLAIEWGGAGGCKIVVADLAEGTLGDSGRCDIRIDTAQGADRVGVAFAHELAHVHGLGHHEGPGLMNKVPPVVLEWTVADEVECHHVNDACAPK